MHTLTLILIGLMLAVLALQIALLWRQHRARPFDPEQLERALREEQRAGRGELRDQLDALRGANIDVQSDCREGLCGSCEVPVLEGEIDHRDRVLTRSERAACTKMMSCCSRARGGKLVLGL